MLFSHQSSIVYRGSLGRILLVASLCLGITARASAQTGGAIVRRGEIPCPPMQHPACGQSGWTHGGHSPTAAIGMSGSIGVEFRELYRVNTCQMFETDTHVRRLLGIYDTFTRATNLSTADFPITPIPDPIVNTFPFYYPRPDSPESAIAWRAPQHVADPAFARLNPDGTRTGLASGVLYPNEVVAQYPFLFALTADSQGNRSVSPLDWNTQSSGAFWPQTQGIDVVSYAWWDNGPSKGMWFASSRRDPATQVVYPALFRNGQELTLVPPPSGAQHYAFSPPSGRGYGPGMAASSDGTWLAAIRASTAGPTALSLVRANTPSSGTVIDLLTFGADTFRIIGNNTLRVSPISGALFNVEILCERNANTATADLVLYSFRVDTQSNVASQQSVTSIQGTALVGSQPPYHSEAILRDTMLVAGRGLRILLTKFGQASWPLWPEGFIVIDWLLPGVSRIDYELLDARPAQGTSLPFHVSTDMGRLRQARTRLEAVPVGGRRQALLKITSAVPGEVEVTLAPGEEVGEVCRPGGALGVAPVRVPLVATGAMPPYDAFIVFKSPLRFDRSSWPGDVHRTQRPVQIWIDHYPVGGGAGERHASVIPVQRESLDLEILDAGGFIDAGTGDILPGQRLLQGGDARVGYVADGVTSLLVRATTSSTGLLSLATLEPNTAGKWGQFRVPGGSAYSTIGISGSNSTQTRDGEVYTFVMRAPMDFVSNSADAALSERAFNLTASWSDGITPRPSTASRLITVTRPPVVFAHGLWSSPATWSGPFAPLSMGQDPRFPMARAMDYSLTSGEPFKVNARAVRLEIAAALAAARDRGLAATQVDWVGHSMGAVLPRVVYAENEMELYSGGWFRWDNFMAGDIHKLIAVNSPQWGSPGANVIGALAESPTMGGLVANILSWANGKYGAPYSRLGAVMDLRQNSDAYRYIARSGPQRIRSKALVGVGGEGLVNLIPGTSVGGLLGVALRAGPFGRYFTLARAVGVTHAMIFGANRHDVVVCEDSQAAGLAPSGATVFVPGSVANILDYTHTFVTSNASYYNEVVSLLNAPASSFAPSLPTPRVNYPPLSMPIPLATWGTMVYTSPANNTSVSAGAPVTVTVVGTGGFSPVEVTFFGPGGWIHDTTPPFQGTFTVPAAMTGNLRLFAFGMDANGAIGQSNTLSLPVQFSATLTQMTAEPANILLTRPLESWPINVLGNYTDSVVRSLTAGSTGTSYTTNSPGVVSVSQDGRVTALAPGTGSIQARNGTLVVNVPCVVDYGPTSNYGYGLAGTGGIAPRISAVGGAPIPGNIDFGIRVSGVVGGAVVGLFRSWAPGNTPLLGGSLYLDPVSVRTIGIAGAKGSQGSPGEGEVTFSLPILDNSTKAGVVYHYQALVLDAGAPGGVAMSNGLAVTMGN